ncbi:MAG: PfkB family carbohydrate kinase, partial [Pseudomonadota bacterium]
MCSEIDILCIGAVLWDVIGRRDGAMAEGDDRPGQITRAPGGVALNVAMALRRSGLRPALLSAVGEDANGTELLAECAKMGLETSYVLRSATTPTDSYMAIEAKGRLIAAIADARGLERAGDRILDALSDGRLGSETAPYAGPVALDGNLTTDLLARIA